MIQLGRWLENLRIKRVRAQREGGRLNDSVLSLLYPSLFHSHSSAILVTVEFRIQDTSSSSCSIPLFVWNYCKDSIKWYQSLRSSETRTHGGNSITRNEACGRINSSKCRGHREARRGLGRNQEFDCRVDSIDHDSEFKV